TSHLPFTSSPFPVASSGGIEITSVKHYPYSSDRKGAAMSEECTRDLPEQSFQERVLAELAAIRGDVAAIRHDIAALDGRLTTLEEKVDRRLQETRPIWQDVLARIGKLDTKFDLVIKELYDVRADQVSLARRVEHLESISSQ
ncbi:MAG: hypothetical protein M3430_13575, partial [Acidobacteriota bacterium]|nr:hypothetical protein [Acidobacteriota bacterium]